MNNIAQITENIKANTGVMKGIKKSVNNAFNTDETIEHFIDRAFDYIKAIKEGRMLCIIKSVSSSGMSRVLKYNAFSLNTNPSTNEALGYYTQFDLVFNVLRYTQSKNQDGYRVNGCGMDMNFHTNYCIIHDLHRLGFIDKSECASLAQKTPTIL